MTKTGKPDAYWEGIMYQYAQGKYRFTTGKKPGAKKWKAVMQLINSCPLTPVYNLPIREYDIFGNRIPCKCRYHMVSNNDIFSKDVFTINQCVAIFIACKLDNVLSS